MVAVFLRGEFDSPRFGAELARLLRQAEVEPAIITSPDLNDDGANSRRRRLLGQVRGFEEDRSLFRKFPPDVQWERAMVTATELKRVRYVSYDFWVELSGGSRMPADAARRIAQGVEIFRQSNDSFWSAANALRAGVSFPEMILVTHDGETLVVVEGHVRLTAFMLGPHQIPTELEVVLGRAAKMTDWPLY